MSDWGHNWFLWGKRTEERSLPSRSGVVNNDEDEDDTPRARESKDSIGNNVSIGKTMFMIIILRLILLNLMKMAREN